MTSPSSATSKPEIDALLNTIIYATITRDEFRARLGAVLESARAAGVEEAVATEALEASSAARARSDVLTHLQRRDTALTIATRIAGETKGGDEMRMDHTEAYRSAVEKLRRAMYVNAAPFNLSYALTQIDEDAPLTFPAWMVRELFAVHEAAGTPMDLHATQVERDGALVGPWAAREENQE